MKWKRANGTGDSGASSGGEAPQSKKGGKSKIILIVIVALVSLVAIFMVSTCKGESSDAKDSELDWPTSGLATMLPKPSTSKGRVYINSDDAFSVTLSECSSSGSSSYVDACKEKGFTVEAKQASDSYHAFNEEGYKLSLYYHKSKEELSVSLEAPDKMSSITWPTSGPGSLVPTPPSTQGSIVIDSSKVYQVNVGGMDKDTFSAYAAQCKEAGFNVDYSSGNTSYTASNADGAKLHINYRGANVVSVRVEAAEASSDGDGASTSSNSTPTDSSTTSDADGSGASTSSNSGSSSASTDSSTASDASPVTPEFKEMLDSYEKLIDKYCDFMATYSSASTADQASMLADYTDLAKQEADWAKRMKAVDRSTLSAADDAYYIEVLARVSQRLIETGAQM